VSGISRNSSDSDLLYRATVFFDKKTKKLVRQNGALLISADEKVLFRSGTNYEKIYYGSLVAFAVY
jgi:hypothetical protein